MNSAMEGYLFKRKTGVESIWRSLFNEDSWISHFYVLTNVGVLVFEEESFLHPSRLIPLGKLRVEPLNKKLAGKDFIFKFIIGEKDELVLGAPNKEQYDKWLEAVSKITAELRSNPEYFKPDFNN